MIKKAYLNRNENFYGPAPQVSQAIRNFAREHVYKYLPGYHGSILLPAISKVYGIPEAQILFSYGSEDFLRTVFNTLQPRDSVLTHKLHFTYYNTYLKNKGIPLHTFTITEGYHGYAFDITDCLKQYKKYRPKVILIASPNNPTGNTVSFARLRKVLEVVSAKTLVIVDEAYYGFDPTYKDMRVLPLLKKYPNLVFARTFSKYYALAGLRIGFALCGKKVKSILQYQSPYLGTSRILEEVGVAALKSKGYYTQSARKIVQDRLWLTKQINALRQFRAYNSKANFIPVKVSAAVHANLKKHLDRQSVQIVKFVTPTLLRITLAPRTHMARLVYIMKQLDY